MTAAETADTARGRWIDTTLGRLDLRQRIGQLMVFGFCGPVLTPDVDELLRRYHIGGLRVTTKFRALNLLSDVAPGQRLPDFKERSLHRPTGLSRDCAHTAPAIAATPRQYAATLNRLRRLALERAAGVPIHIACDQEATPSMIWCWVSACFPIP